METVVPVHASTERQPSEESALRVLIGVAAEPESATQLQLFIGESPARPLDLEPNGELPGDLMGMYYLG